MPCTLKWPEGKVWIQITLLEESGNTYTSYDGDVL